MRTEAAVFWSTNSVVQKKSVSQHLQQFAMGEKMAFLSRSSEKKKILLLLQITGYKQNPAIFLRLKDLCHVELILELPQNRTMILLYCEI